MAARKNRLHTDDVRERIKTSQLINRLQDNALGDLQPELSRGRLKSIEVLLRKSLPDVSAVEITGKDGKDLIPETNDLDLARRLAFILTKATA